MATRAPIANPNMQCNAPPTGADGEKIDRTSVNRRVASTMVV
jgi:hypothetical protein